MVIIPGLQRRAMPNPPTKASTARMLTQPIPFHLLPVVNTTVETKAGKSSTSVIGLAGINR